MKKTYLTIFLLFVFCLYSFAQKQKEYSSQLDSLLQEVNRKNITPDDRYRLIATSNLYTCEEQIVLFNEVLKYTRNHEDKGQAMSLYNLISSVYMAMQQFEESQIYSDSAILFKEQTTNMKALGGIYYQRALLTSSRGGDKHLVIDDLYTAISYYEQIEDGALPMIVMLKEIAKYYIEMGDLESIRETMYDILKISREVNNPLTDCYAYPICTHYYQSMYRNTQDKVYLDSLMTYSDSIIYSYNLLDEDAKMGLKHQVGISYLSYADAILNSDSIDWDRIEEYIAYANEMVIENLYVDRLNLHIMNATIALHKGRYQTAIDEGLLAEKLLDTDSLKRLVVSLSVYQSLAQSYAGANNYKQALEYVYKQLDVERKMKRKEEYEAIKELDIKYQTAKKDLRISKLNEDKQQAKFRIVLVSAVSIILIILFLIGLLYNRVKRLKKEKETVLLKSHIKQKDLEYKNLVSETEHRLIRRYLDGRESERKLLAKELHDSVANEMISIIMLNQTENNTKKVNTLLKDTYNHIRQISHQLMPPEFKYISLIGMIEDYIDLLNSTTNIKFKLNINNSEIHQQIENISDKKVKEIYYLLQEMLGNVLKHAKANNVTVSIVQYDEVDLILSVEDDGIGFDTQTIKKGIGMRTMQDRCQDIKAEFQIESIVGKGSKISVTFSSIYAEATIL